MDKQRLIQSLLPNDDSSQQTSQHAFILAELVAGRYANQSTGKAKEVANEIADLIRQVAAAWRRHEGL